MLAIAPSDPVISLFAINSCNSTTAAMTINATAEGPNATRNRSRAWRLPTDLFSTTSGIAVLCSRARYSRTRGEDYDDELPDWFDDDPEDEDEDDDCGCAGTWPVGADGDDCGWL